MLLKVTVMLVTIERWAEPSLNTTLVTDGATAVEISQAPRP